MGNKLIKTYETPTDFTICVYQSEKSGKFAVTTYDCVTEKHSDVKWHATMEEAMADANSRENGYELDESKETIRLNEGQLKRIVKESVKKVLKENTSNISTVEDLCSLLGCSINEQEEVQLKIEKLLVYLRGYGIIDRFDEDKLDWLFSDEQSY